MSSQNIDDFLTKQILLEGNIVTYRSLSRQLSLHVNAAKNCLASFYAKVREEDQSKLAVTYLVSGMQSRESARMDVDNEEPEEKDAEYDDEGYEETEMAEIVLVGEKDLEDTKSKFVTISSVSVYSLSPAPIRDMGLICGPTEIVRDIDNKKGAEMVATVGKIIGNVTEGGQFVPIPSTSVASASTSRDPAPETTGNATKKTAAPAEKPKAKDFFANMKPKESKTAKASSRKVKEESAKTKSKSKDAETEDKPTKQKQEPTSDSEVEKGKPNAMYNPITWAAVSSRAKSKENRAGSKGKFGALMSDSENEAKPAAGSKSKVKRGVILSDDETEDLPPKTKTKENKAGTKRKSGALISESEDEPAYESKSKVKKVIVSDDELEDAPPKAKAKGKGKQVVKEEEKDVYTMMDIDDDQVEVVRSSRSRKASAEPPQTDGDVEMEDDTDPKPVPKAKKKNTKTTKKQVPVGKNGLKKKRVIKSKMSQDEKGYIITEDYSSYESVDEEEPEPEPQKSKGKRGKSTSEDKDKTGTVSKAGGNNDEPVTAKAKEPKAAAKTKPKASNKGSGSGKKADIASFFSKK